MFTTNQITSALVAYRSAADQDTATASSIAAALLSYYTMAQVDGLLAGKRGPLQIAEGPTRWWPPLGPTDVLLSNWTVRPSSGCSVVLATHTAGVSVDGYTLTLAANPWNIVRTYNLTPGRELSARPPTSERSAGDRARGVHARREHARAVHVVAQQLVAAHVALRGEPVQRGRAREGQRVRQQVRY